MSFSKAVRFRNSCNKTRQHRLPQCDLTTHTSTISFPASRVLQLAERARAAVRPHGGQTHRQGRATHGLQRRPVLRLRGRTVSGLAGCRTVHDSGLKVGLQVLLVFSRDGQVIRNIKSQPGYMQVVLKGKQSTPDNTMVFPPSGVIPFHGFTMYGKETLCGVVQLCAVTLKVVPTFTWRCLTAVSPTVLFPVGFHRVKYEGGLIST